MKKVLLASVVLLASAASANVALAGEKGDTYGSKGAVVFEAKKTPTDPEDPNEPGEPVTPGIDPEFPETPEPGTNGPLSIDFASSFGFGTQDITTADKVYDTNIQTYVKKIKDKETGEWIPDPANKLTEGPNYVQVSDNRGTEAGWTLKVKQDNQFTTQETNHVLKGAKISFTNGIVVTDSDSARPTNTPSFTLDFDNTTGSGSAEAIVMQASSGAGAGSYLNNFGTWAEKEENSGIFEGNAKQSVQLSVPGSTTKYAERYVTNFVWTLSDTVPTK